MSITRRAALGGLAALAGCSHRADKPAGKPTPDWHDLAFSSGGEGDGEQRALVYAPPGSASWPVLVALHGRGEAGRGVEAGARGWRDDYDLQKAVDALRSGEIRSEDAGHMLSLERLEALNRSLRAAPFVGLVIACPYTPVPRGRAPEDAAPFARFLTDSLLPKVAEVRGGAVERKATGIDGVSMGGRYALSIGLTKTETFASVGGLQPAIQVGEADAFADLAARAAERAPFAIRLVSSEEDPFLEPTRALASALDARKIVHRLVVTSGPHDYAWNRGPGSLELLIHHERVLRGLPAP
ncbi:MAG: esterase [Myxococcales bacterium]|nr:esterase [Myxococcales bacterium]